MQTKRKDQKVPHISPPLFFLQRCEISFHITSNCESFWLPPPLLSLSSHLPWQSGIPDMSPPSKISSCPLPVQTTTHHGARTAASLTAGLQSSPLHCKRPWKPQRARVCVCACMCECVRFSMCEWFCRLCPYGLLDARMTLCKYSFFFFWGRHICQFLDSNKRACLRAAVLWNGLLFSMTWRSRGQLFISDLWWTSCQAVWMHFDSHV